jgi:uncharacterized protein YqgC (DUF456 family)
MARAGADGRELARTFGEPAQTGLHAKGRQHGSVEIETLEHGWLKCGAPPPSWNGRCCRCREFALGMDLSLLAWGGVMALIVLGIAGTVLPALPGTVLVLAGIAWGAWLDDFRRVPMWVVGVCAVLAALAWATDYVAAMLGAKRVRASGWAIAGAAAGTVAGIFTGFIGLLFMPLLGAMAGEWWALRSHADHVANGRRAFEVGFATWLGMMIGTAVKLALVFVMVGAFAVACFF